MNALQLWTPGSPSLFDIIENIREHCAIDEVVAVNESEKETYEDIDIDPTTWQGEPERGLVSDSIKIFRTEPITERKSVFIGHACAISSLDDVKRVIDHIKSDNRVARATHNIYAYRFASTSAKLRGDDTFLQDHDSDGEDAAGSRMQNLLEIADIQNVFVLVTRWYGGVKLGPDRFRIINQVARNAMECAGLIEPGSKKGKHADTKT